MDQDSFPRSHLLFLAVVLEGGAALMAWGLGRFFGYEPRQWIVWEFRPLWLGLLAALPLLAAFFLSLQLTVGPFGRLQRIGEEMVKPLFGECGIGDLAVVSVLAGVGEELLFRGFLQLALADLLHSQLLGLAGAAAIFGLLHFITPTYFLLATAAGIYLGGLTFWSGNVLSAIIAHALYDFIALLWIVRRSPPSA